MPLGVPATLPERKANAKSGGLSQPSKWRCRREGKRKRGGGKDEGNEGGRREGGEGGDEGKGGAPRTGGHTPRPAPSPPWVHLKSKVQSNPTRQRLRPPREAGVFFSRQRLGGSQSHRSILPDAARCAHHSSLGQTHLKRKIRLEHRNFHCVYFTKCRSLCAG